MNLNITHPENVGNGDVDTVYSLNELFLEERILAREWYNKVFTEKHSLARFQVHGFIHKHWTVSPASKTAKKAFWWGKISTETSVAGSVQLNLDGNAVYRSLNLNSNNPLLTYGFDQVVISSGTGIIDFVGLEFRII